MLKKVGHNIIKWAPYKHDYANNLISKIYAADGGADILTMLKESGEPPIPNIADLASPSLQKLDINELWDVNLKKWAYQSEYLEQLRLAEERHGKEIDAIIAPVAPTASLCHDQYRYYGYATVINLLDFTSVVVPVTFADKNIDKKQEGYKPLSEIDRVVYDECEH